MRPMNPLASSYEKDNLRKDRKHIQDFHEDIIQVTNKALRKAYFQYLDSNNLSNNQIELLDKFVTYVERYKFN